MRSYLLLQQCHAGLVRLTWVVLEIGGKWPYNCCFVGCCFQDFFNIASTFFCCSFSLCILSAYMWCTHRVVFIFSNRSDFHMIDSLSIAVHAFTRRILISLSVDETQLLRYVNLSANF